MPQSDLSGVSELKFLKGNYSECLFGSTFTLDPESFRTGWQRAAHLSSPFLTSLLPSSPLLSKTAPQRLDNPLPVAKGRNRAS